MTKATTEIALAVKRELKRGLFHYFKLTLKQNCITKRTLEYSSFNKKLNENTTGFPVMHHT